MIIMSIDVLKQRLAQSVSNFSETTQIDGRFSRPHRLIKTLDVIERKFEDMENAQPVEEKILRSIRKLEQHGKDYLTKRDWKNLAWSLSRKLPAHNEKVLFTAKGAELLGYFNQIELNLLSSVYFPLLYSYFAIEEKELKSNKTDNWVSLRQILSKNRSSVFQSSNRPKKWLITLTDNPELLTTEPSKKLTHQFLKDKDDNRVSNELESLNIASNSWFWDNLVYSAIHSIQSMKEDEFLMMIGRFLRLMEKHPIYTNDILVALLERYAVSSLREIVHERLKDISLEQWGNPQYDSSAGWQNVKQNTKRMVIQWFVRADLESFFTVFSRGADVRRFNYWMRFIKQVTFSEIFLNEQAIYYPTAQQAEFKKNNTGRFKKIDGKSSANAFMIKLGGFYIVEFSEMNNATYFYNQVPYASSKRKIHLRDLKSTYRAEFYLSHNGAWENSFDRKLKALGIFPD